MTRLLVRSLVSSVRRHGQVFQGLPTEGECPIVESRGGEVGFPIGWRHRRGGSSCRETGLGGSGDRVSRDGTYPRTEHGDLAGEDADLVGEGVDQGIKGRQLLDLGLLDGREAPELLADGCDCLGRSREQTGVFRQGGRAFHAGWVQAGQILLLGCGGKTQVHSNGGGVR